MKNNTGKKSLIGLTVPEIEKELRCFEQPSYRAAQIYKWLHHKNIDQFMEMTNIPLPFRKELDMRFDTKTLHPLVREVSSDGTEKYLWELQDGRRVESVLIPEERRLTICISSQVGCSLGCHFCATAQMGFIRNLEPGEMVEQILQTQKLTRKKVTNVVFMGMGEPFLNYTRVIKACQIMRDPEGLAISARRITISTSGVIPPIYQFTDEGHPFGLAISLHAPNQRLREQIMPLAQKFPLNKLMESARYYTSSHPRNRITFEYVLLAGINDSESDARQMAQLLSPLRCKLNLIPCNENDLGFRAPSRERIELFKSILLKAPFTVTLRRNRGQDITAACGQLYAKTNSIETPRFIPVKSKTQ